MEARSRTSNVINAASSLKNFEFDFGLPNSITSKGNSLGSLKQKSSVDRSPPVRANPSPSNSPLFSTSPTASVSSRLSSPGTQPTSPWSHSPLAQSGIVKPSLDPNSDSLANLWKSTSGQKFTPSLRANDQQKQNSKLDSFSILAGESAKGISTLGSMKESKKSVGNGSQSTRQEPFTYVGSFESKGRENVIPRKETSENLQPQAVNPVNDQFGDFNFASSVKKDFPPAFEDIKTEANISHFDDFSFNSSAPHTAASVPSQASSVSLDPFDFLQGSPRPAVNLSSSDAPFESLFPGAEPQKSAPALHAVDSLFGDTLSGSIPATFSSVDPMDALFGPPATQQPPSPGPADALLDLLMKPTPATADAADIWSGSGDFPSANEPAAETTTELREVGSAPAGLSAEAALKKGSEFQKGGQFADAIKWLLWAEELCRSSGQTEGGKRLLVEVLRSRASCYKEAGEMKKAIADCTRVIDLLPENTVALMQRARLYEATEKYRLGVQDLKRVTQLDPSNRQAGAMLARLNKAANAS